MLQLKSTPPGRKSILCYARSIETDPGGSPRETAGDAITTNGDLAMGAGEVCISSGGPPRPAQRLPANQRIRECLSGTRDPRRAADHPVGVVGESAREVPQDPTTDLEAARRPCLFTLLRRRESNVGGFVTRSKNAIRLFRLRRYPLHSMSWRIVETRDPLKSCRGECRARQAG